MRLIKKFSLPFSLILIYCLGLVSYLNSFNGEFVFDDVNTLIYQDKLKNISSISSIWSINYYRFIPNLSYALNYSLDKYNPVGYHIINFAIHILNSFLVYLFTLEITKTKRIKNLKLKGLNLIPLLTALLFTVHPIQTQAVNFISQRSALLACFFYLLTLVLYLRRNLFTYLLSLITLALALISKENSYTLPVTILFTELFLFKKNKNAILKIVPFFLLTIFLFYFIQSNGSRNPISTFSKLSMVQDAKISRKEYFLTQTAVINKYLSLIFLPINQNIDYDFPIYKKFSDRRVIISTFIIALLLFTAIKTRKTKPLFTYGIMIFFAALFVESSIIPIKDVIYEHRMYLPSTGLFIAIVSTLTAFEKNRIFYPLTVLLIASFMLTTINRNKVWQSEYNLWKDAASKSPNKSRVHYNLGVASYGIGKIDEAKREFIKTISIDPNYTNAYRNLGSVFEGEGNDLKALELFNSGLEKNYYDSALRAQLASHYSKNSNYGEAIKQYLTIIGYDSKNYKAYNDLGIIYLIQNKKEDAILTFEKAIKLNPLYENAYQNLANVYYSSGDDENAKKYYLKLLKINPGNAQAIANLKLL